MYVLLLIQHLDHERPQLCVVLDEQKIGQFAVHGPSDSGDSLPRAISVFAQNSHDVQVLGKF